MPALPFSRFLSVAKPFVALAFAFVLAVSPASACTIFVLTDGTRTLFFNNEDWFNPATRLWFVPAAPDQLGCAFVGFDNGWAQGGVNYPPTSSAPLKSNFLSVIGSCGRRSDRADLLDLNPLRRGEAVHGWHTTRRPTRSPIETTSGIYPRPLTGMVDMRG